MGCNKRISFNIRRLTFWHTCCHLLKAKKPNRLRYNSEPMRAVENKQVAAQTVLCETAYTPIPHTKHYCGKQ